MYDSAERNVQLEAKSTKGYYICAHAHKTVNIGRPIEKHSSCPGISISHSGWCKKRKSTRRLLATQFQTNPPYLTATRPRSSIKHRNPTSNRLAGI